MSDEDSIRDELAQLRVPAESPTFFDDLWRRANERERAVARRWRYSPRRPAQRRTSPTCAARARRSIRAARRPVSSRSRDCGPTPPGAPLPRRRPHRVPNSRRDGSERPADTRAARDRARQDRCVVDVRRLDPDKVIGYASRRCPPTGG